MAQFDIEFPRHRPLWIFVFTAMVCVTLALCTVQILFGALWRGLPTPSAYVLGARNTAEEYALCYLVAQEVQARDPRAGRVSVLLWGPPPDPRAMAHARVRLLAVVAALQREGQGDGMTHLGKLCLARSDAAR